jgi:hypothetical protein
VFAVRVSPGGPAAPLDALPASDNAPATPNTVTAFVRPFRFEFRLPCDMTGASHFSANLVCHPTPRTAARQRSNVDKHLRRSGSPMSALGHQRTSECDLTVSALPPKADTIQHDRDVRFLPIADIQAAVYDVSGKVLKLLEHHRETFPSQISASDRRRRHAGNAAPRIGTTSLWPDPKIRAQLVDLSGAVLVGSPADFGKLICRRYREMGQSNPGGKHQGRVIHSTFHISVPRTRV